MDWYLKKTNGSKGPFNVRKMSPQKAVEVVDLSLESDDESPSLSLKPRSVKETVPETRNGLLSLAPLPSSSEYSKEEDMDNQMGPEEEEPVEEDLQGQLDRLQKVRKSLQKLEKMLKKSKRRESNGKRQKTEKGKQKEMTLRLEEEEKVFLVEEKVFLVEEEEPKKKGRPRKRHREVEALLEKDGVVKPAPVLQQKRRRKKAEDGMQEVKQLRPFHFESTLYREPTCFGGGELNVHQEKSAMQLAYLSQMMATLRLKVGDSSASVVSRQIHESFVEKMMRNNHFCKMFETWPSFLREAFKSFEKYSTYFLPPDQVESRPFMSDQRIEKVLNDPTVGLLDGDVIHVPFTPEEEGLVKSNIGDDKDISYSVIARLVPGRTAADCKRFIQGALRNNIPGATFTHKEIVVYRKKQKERKSTFWKLQQRQMIDTTRSPALCTRSIQRSLFESFVSVSQATDCSGEVIECHFHPSGNQLVVCSASAPNEALIYDLKRAKVKSLDAHKDTVSQIRYSLNGENILTAGFDKCVRVWTSGGDLVHTLGPQSADLAGHTERVDLLALHSAKEDIFASASDDKSVIVWNIETGEALHQFGIGGQATHWPGPLLAMCFGNGQYADLLMGASDATDDRRGQVRFWDVETGKLSLMDLHTGGISSIGVSALGTTFLTAGAADQVVNLSDLRTREVVQTFKCFQRDVNVVSFSPCERYIQSSGTDNRALVFDVRNGTKPVFVLEHDPSSDNEDQSQGVATSLWSKGGFLITGGEDGTVRIWDVHCGSPLVKVLKGHTSAINALALSPEEDLIASGGDERAVHLFTVPGNSRFRLNTLDIREMGGRVQI